MKIKFNTRKDFWGKHYSNAHFVFTVIRDYNAFPRNKYFLYADEKTFDNERNYYYNKYLGTLEHGSVSLEYARILINEFLNDHNHDNQ